MKYDQEPERDVQQMSPVEDFETAAATDERKGTDEHHHEDDEEKKTGRICPSADQPEEHRSRCEEELVQSEVFGVDNRIADDEEA